VNHPLTSTRAVPDERLRRIIGHLSDRDDARTLLTHVAAERLRTLEALSTISPDDPRLARLQGRAEGLAWLIGLFNRTDDEE
jgi:hypothetical protein